MSSNPSNMNPDFFISYLAKHGITEVKQRGNEVSFACPFGCDDDHRNNEEWHCGYDCGKCVWKCFKCGEKGNFITLLKHFGDYEEWNAEQKAGRKISKRGRKTSSLKDEARKAHDNMPEFARKYFYNRGITDESIDRFMLGYWDRDGRHGYSIPVFDKTGDVSYIKLRRTLEDEEGDRIAEAMGSNKKTPKYLIYPNNSKTILVGEDQLAKSTSSKVLICEGELDRVMAIQEGVDMPVVTSGGGAQTFKDEWFDAFEGRREIYLCFDRDKPGRDGSDSLAHRFANHCPMASVFMVNLPFADDTKADLSDYFNQKMGTADELFSKYSEYYCGAKPIDVSAFKEMTVDDIAKVLDLTIKDDYVNKVIVFLGMILAYTEDSQINIMLNGSSGSGKSFIVMETSKLFPKQDVITYYRISPTAPFYLEDLAKVDEDGVSYTDWERRIIIFAENANTQLLETVRSFLSHDADDKKIKFALTNKVKNSNIAKVGYIFGYSSIFFCTASMRVDDQEQTRCIMLSPENSQEKLMMAVDASISKNCHRSTYDAAVGENEDRRLLMDRIQYIKGLHVDYVDIEDEEYLKKRFMENYPALTSEAPRKTTQFSALVKAIALVNAPFRMIDGRVVATRKDIDEAAKLWSKISESASIGISPQALWYLRQIIQAYISVNTAAGRPKEKWRGITKAEFRKEFRKMNGVNLNGDYFRKNVMEALLDASLISYEKKLNIDERHKLITPIFFPDEEVEENS